MLNYKSKLEYIDNCLELLTSDIKYIVSDSRILDHKDSSLKPYWYFEAINKEMVKYDAYMAKATAGKSSLKLPSAINKGRLNSNLFLLSITKNTIWKELIFGTLENFKSKLVPVLKDPNDRNDRGVATDIKGK